MISSHYGRVLFRELTGVGVEPEELLRGTHLTPDRLWNHPKLDPQDFLTLLRNARTQNHNLRLGLLAGGKNRVAGLGIMGVAMMAAPTLGDGLKAMTSYSSVEAGYIRFPVVVGHTHTRIEFKSEVDLGDCLDIHVEAVFSLFQDYIEDLVGASEQAVSFSVTYDETNYGEIYQTLFKGPVRYKQSINAVYFPTPWLKIASPYKDDSNWLLSQRLLGEQLQAASGANNNPFTQHVKYTLQAQEPPLPDANHLAASLHLSARTLNRRLREEGATFRQLKVEAIHHGAKRMLLEGVSVEAIAAIHGYENAANFRRSFRLTNGCSPKEWLKREQTQEPTRHSDAL